MGGGILDLVVFVLFPEIPLKKLKLFTWRIILGPCSVWTKFADTVTD